MKHTKEDLQHALDYISKLCPVGKTVYTTVHKVSSTGMSRTMSVFVVDEDDSIRNITSYVAMLTGNTYLRDKNHLRVGGCGMDMGFHVVYSLGRCLYPDGFKLPKDKKYGRNGDTSGYDKDGGYALNQQWL